jgi:uncharacterized protein YecE (DUF72 family)
VLNKPPGPAYAQQLLFAEIRPQSPLPRPSTLRRWRYRLPEGFAFALNAPRSAIVSRRGPCRLDAELQQGLDWTLGAAEALGAIAVVMQTPVELTTSARDRDLFTAYVERLPRQQGSLWVWAPSGLWEPESAHPFADKLGLICAFDPLNEPSPKGEVLYARLLGLGTRRRFTEAALREIAGALVLPEVSRAYAAFDSEGSFRSAVSLRKTTHS